MMLKQPEGGIREFTGDGRQLRGPAEANNRLLREDRYEVTAKLAYEHWEKKGRPLGSPDVDWYAAEATLREYLVASGIEIGPNGSFYC